MRMGSRSELPCSVAVQAGIAVSVLNNPTFRGMERVQSFDVSLNSYRIGSAPISFFPRAESMVMAKPMSGTSFSLKPNQIA